MFRFSTNLLIALACLGMTFSACRKPEIKKEYKQVDSFENLPQVGTPPIDSVSYTEAYATCRVYAEGGSAVTECGLCWDTEPSPLRLGSRIGTGQGKGTFKAKIEGLKPSTKYYLRAYAMNSEGISYGNEITFTTSAGWTYYSANPNSNAMTKLFYHNNFFYISSYSSVYVSNNPTNGWTSTSLNGASDFAANGNIVCAATGANLYLTANDGNSWTSRNAGTYVYNLVFTDAIYATSGNGVRKSINNGVTWTSQNSGLSGYTQAMAAKSSDLYVGTSIGLYKSNNSAASWTSIKQGGINAIALSGNNIILGTSEGIQVSKDNGITWLSPGILTNMTVNIHCTGKNVVAWSTSNNFVYISNDEGSSWKQVIFTLNDFPSSITSDASYFYATAGSGIYRLQFKL